MCWTKLIWFWNVTLSFLVQTIHAAWVAGCLSLHKKNWNVFPPFPFSKIVCVGLEILFTQAFEIIHQWIHMTLQLSLWENCFDKVTFSRYRAIQTSCLIFPLLVSIFQDVFHLSCQIYWIYSQHFLVIFLMYMWCIITSIPDISDLCSFPSFCLLLCLKSV